MSIQDQGGALPGSPEKGEDLGTIRIGIADESGFPSPLFQTRIKIRRNRFFPAGRIDRGNPNQFLYGGDETLFIDAGHPSFGHNVTIRCLRVKSKGK
jgi:hypothetical protein